MSKKENFRSRAINTIDTLKDDLLALSHDIFEYAELAFEEVKSSSRIKGFLAEHGFRVRDVDGLPTAFVAEIGSGFPVIALMAEYDALPEIGHACGHNIIAAAAVGAGLGVNSFINESGGTVRVVGTPAEEGGAAKLSW